MPEDKNHVNEQEFASGFSRRTFLQIGLGGMGVAMAGPAFAALGLVTDVDNPLEAYPKRGWEKLYRDIFKYDSHYHFLCAPNDTHNCLLRAHVKNDVVTRIGPSFGYGKAEDLYGNKASTRWDPRLCQKGLALINRIYGPRRIKYPMVRKGFKDWADKGFPRDAEGRPLANHSERGKDEWVRVTAREAARYVAKAAENTARTYSGKKGQDLLLKQGYDPDMVEATHGAGTQVLKNRGGMPLLGATRVMGMFRFSNSLALLDAKIRGVDSSKAVGGRMWDSYTWHTDLPPGHPMVTGQQTVDCDLSEAENSDLVIPWGMNWISTKMPDGHWLTEARLKGAKVVVVSVEYSSVANKCDELIVIRPGSDGDDQVTTYTFGDSYSASLVTKVQYPDGDATDDNVQFTYNLDGSVATRTAQKPSGGTSSRMSMSRRSAASSRNS